MTASPSDGSLKVNGLAVVRRTRANLDPALPTVLFVHGAMDRAASFSRVMRRLVQFDLIAFDRRGYSGSLSAGVNTTLDGHVDDLVEVIEFSGSESVVVIGHSLGGTLALGLAARADSRVKGLGVFESPMPGLDNSYASVGAGAIERGDEQGPASAAEFFYRLMVGEATWTRLRERDREARRAEGPALLAELRSLRTPSAAIDPLGISLPVLLGVGSESPSSLRTGSALLHAALPCSEMVEIRGAGHGAHLSHADEFARYVQSCVVFAGRP